MTSPTLLTPQKITVRQAGTRDPLLQCLYLDKHLLKQQNTKKLSGTKVFLVAQMIKHLPAMQENQVQSLGREDLLEKEMATHPSFLA